MLEKYLSYSLILPRGRFRSAMAAGIVAACALLPARAQDIPDELVHYPDFVFYNGQVLTADADRDFTVAEAVAVRGNRIFKVGSDAQIRRLAGPDTRVIDLKGRSLTPGFIYNDGDNSVPAGDILKDSQWQGITHPHLGGRTLDEALATLAHVVENEGEPGEPFFFNLQDQWAGVALQSWNRSILDEVAPENPVMIYLSANTGLANKAMLDRTRSMRRFDMRASMPRGLAETTTVEKPRST